MVEYNVLDTYRWQKAIRKSYIGEDKAEYSTVLTNSFNNVLAINVVYSSSSKEWTIKYKCLPDIPEFESVSFTNVEDASKYLIDMGDFLGFEHDSFFTRTSDSSLNFLLEYPWDECKTLDNGDYYKFRCELMERTARCVISCVIKNTHKGSYKWVVNLHGEDPYERKFSFEKEVANKTEANFFIEHTRAYINVTMQTKFKFPFGIDK